MSEHFSRLVAADLEGWDAIDDHRTGTAGDRQTSEWLATCVRAAGLSPRIDDFELSRWELGHCAIESGGVVVEGVPLFDGGTTDGEGIVGRLALLADGVDGVGEPAIGVGSFGHNAGHDANARLAEARESEQYGALVAVSKMDANVHGLAVQNADRFTSPFGPPVLQVATEHEAWLRDAASRGGRARVTADVRFVEALGSNVVCRVPGSDPSLEPLVVMTPKSAWWVCTAERGGGIAVWLWLLRHHAKKPPPRDILFVSTSGHELGHLGLDHFLAAHSVRRARAWIHLGANFGAAGSKTRLQASDASLFELARSALASAGVVRPVETPLGQRAVGEARNIHDIGGRYVSFLGSNAWFHHPDDRYPATVDLGRIRRMAEAVLAISNRLV